MLPFRSLLHVLVFTLVTSLAVMTILTGCNDTGWPVRSPVVVDSVNADALVTHPSVDHALPGDTLTVSVHDLKTVYECSRVLMLTPVVTDSATRRFVSFNASVEKPGTPECPLTPGLDTGFTTIAPAAGATLILRTPSGKATDTVVVFAGTGIPINLRIVTADTVHSVSGLTFRDSTAGHPRRVLYGELEACTLFQLATFTRLPGPTPDSDTLSIDFRLLTASPALPESVLPACAGPHADTVVVVRK